ARARRAGRGELRHRHECDAVDGTGRNAELASRAPRRDHGVHALGRADDRVHGARLDALGAADAGRLVDHGGLRRAVEAVGGIERLRLAPQERGDAPDTFVAAGRALVDVRIAARDRLGAGAAGVVAALGALRLRQPRVAAPGA